MTNEECIEILDKFAHHSHSEVIEYPRKVAIEAFEMAIEALKAEPCEDAVSKSKFDLRVRAAVGMVEEELTEDFKDGIKIVLELLKTEPSVTPKPTECEDCVSREAVLDALHVEGRPTKRFDYVIDVRKDIMALPPVTPKQKTGKWIDNHTTCECCGWQMIDDVMESPNMVFFPFCPNCGAKMEGESE